MRILAVDEEVPFPPNSGKRLRTFNLFKHLAARHEITWIARSLGGVHSGTEGFESLGIRCIQIDRPVLPKSGLRFYAALLTNLFSRYPYSVMSHRSKPMTDAVGRLLDHTRFDLIHCEWTPYAFNLLPFVSVPRVIMAHNVESKVWERDWRARANPLGRAYFYLQWRKMRRFEEEILPQFDHVVSVSEVDGALLSQWVSEDRVSVVSNGVDIDLFRPCPDSEAPHSLVFTGSLDWRANVDCVFHFLDHIWPLIRAKYPDSVLTVVGRNPISRLRRRLARTQSVILKASVDDVRPYIGRAMVCVVPLRIGSGSRLKILEAFAMGKAVVSTRIGAEGLAVESGKHLLLADTPSEFAQAVSRLFEDGELRRRLGAEGRSLVESEHSWAALALSLEAVWRKTSSERPGNN